LKQKYNVSCDQENFKKILAYAQIKTTIKFSQQTVKRWYLSFTFV